MKSYQIVRDSRLSTTASIVILLMVFFSLHFFCDRFVEHPSGMVKPRAPDQEGVAFAFVDFVENVCWRWTGPVSVAIGILVASLLLTLAFDVLGLGEKSGKVQKIAVAVQTVGRVGALLMVGLLALGLYLYQRFVLVI